MFSKTRAFSLRFGRADELIAGNNGFKTQFNGAQKPPDPVEPIAAVCALLMPARDEADEIAALMLVQLLNRRCIGARTVSASALASERVEEASQQPVGAVCVIAIPPFARLSVRYLCKRLRAQFPRVRIVAALLTRIDPQEPPTRDVPIPADQTVTSLAGAVAEIVSLLPAASEHSEQTAFSS